jgi:GDP-L-fucose synthase
MNRDEPIFVAGHQGLVGSALLRRLAKAGFTNLLIRTRAELDLRQQAAVDAFFDQNRPAYVFLAAAKVGGIHANSAFPADFIRDNLQLQTNVIDASYRYGAQKLVFLGSSCIYPKHAPQPMREDTLLTGPLEPTNQWYAVAKIAGVKMCEAYFLQHGFRTVSAMPTNLYGPGDNFNLENSHVMPALIRKFHEAKVGGATEVIVWGTGTPRREFLHVDDFADAALFLMQHFDKPGLINVGVGEDLPIAELARLVAGVVGFAGRIVFDTSRPDGPPRKLLDVSQLRDLGWQARIPLEDGIRATYEWYLSNAATTRA